MSQFETKLLAPETTKKGRDQECLRSNFWKFKQRYFKDIARTPAMI